MSFNVAQLDPSPDDNKNSRGKLTVVAGSSRYPGAAVLAACAGQRMGAGYTEVVTASEAKGIVLAASPSLVVLSREEWQPKQLAQYSEARPCAVCIGPGFEGSIEEHDLVARVLGHAACPVLVDGGGLAALGGSKALKRLKRRQKAGWATVATPHGGEAARLAKKLGIAESDPALLAQQLARALFAVVVLKGPDTFVSDGQRTEAMTEGTPALAKAGTGDVLAGMIGALLAQGIEPFDAAFGGASVHAAAGRRASERTCEIAVTAEDVLGAIPDALSKMR